MIFFCMFAYSDATGHDDVAVKDRLVNPGSAAGFCRFPNKNGTSHICVNEILFSLENQIQREIIIMKLNCVKLQSIPTRIQLVKKNQEDSKLKNDPSYKQNLQNQRSKQDMQVKFRYLIIVQRRDLEGDRNQPSLSLSQTMMDVIRLVQIAGMFLVISKRDNKKLFSRVGLICSC